MTSENASSSIIVEPKQRDYQNAHRVVTEYISLDGSKPVVREAATIVANALEILAADVPDPYFYPFRKGSTFYENWAAGFSRLPIFNEQRLRGVELESQIFRIFNLVYAYRLEFASKTGGFTDLDLEIFSLPQREAFPAFAAAELEVFRSRIVISAAVDEQEEIRRSIRTETEASATRLGSLTESIKNWEKKLDYWKDKTADLEKLITDQHQDLNFVGLSKAFSDLVDKRKVELNAATTAVKQFGTSVILFPVLAYVVASQFHSAIKFDWSILSLAIPSLTIELLLLYFFRIALRNEYSLKAQLLQLELRYSVCAFIQGYAEFAKNTRTADGEKTLEKFESLVFSGITADIQNIPSQFDGVEQLASLIKGIRGKD